MIIIPKKNRQKIARLSQALVLSLFIVFNSISPVFADDPGRGYSHNGILFFNIGSPEAAQCNVTPAPATVPSFNGGSNVKNAFDYLVAQFTSIGQGANAKMIASSIIGNLQQESTDKLDPKATNPLSGAYGIAQWLGGRLDGDGANSLKGHEGSNYDKLAGQLDFLWFEIHDGAEKAYHVIDHMSNPQGANDVEKVRYLAKEWEASYERSGGSALQNRQENAVKVFTDPSLGGGSSLSGTTGGGCACGPSAGSGPTIVLDPGHSKDSFPTETQEGIVAQDNDGAAGERQGVFDTAKLVESDLRQAGYNVIMTKQNADDNVGLIKRAQIANDAHADLAVSLHYDKGYTWNDMGWVTPQTLTASTPPGDNEQRTHRTTGQNTKFFDQKPNAQELASKSAQYAQAIKDARSAAEGRPAQIHDLGQSFPPSRGLPSYGNMSIVQLFGNVPWVYNEVGTSDKFDATAYAKGIAEGIKKALPISGAQGAGSGATAGCASNPGANGDLAALAMFYAWPDYHAPPYLEYKPSYKDATDKAQAAGKYVGGLDHPGVDCGGFVTRVVQNSGFDPDYGGGGATDSQRDWMEKHPNKYKALGPVTSTDQLQPGDIAITPAGVEGHTFMYVGKNGHPDFHSDVASASVSFTGRSWRTPMAGHEQPDGHYLWFHPIK